MYIKCTDILVFHQDHGKIFNGAKFVQVIKGRPFNLIILALPLDIRVSLNEPHTNCM